MHGVLAVDKGEGLSSGGAVARVRRALGRDVRVGHAGTLDPFATGLLLILAGDATRLSDLGMTLEKTYVAHVRLGVTTATLDTEVPISERADPGPYRPGALHEALDALTGRIEQVPPAYSALKVDGRRAYDLARKGREVALAPRSVVVHRIMVLAVRWPDVVLRIRCGKGTYIRSLARDLGVALGVPAMLTALRRTAIGSFGVDSALPVGVQFDGASVTERAWSRPIDLSRSAGVPESLVDDEGALAFCQGAALDVRRPDGPGPWAITWRTGPDDPTRLLGLGPEVEGARTRRVVLSDARRAVESVVGPRRAVAPADPDG